MNSIIQNSKTYSFLDFDRLTELFCDSDSMYMLCEYLGIFLNDWPYKDIKCTRWKRIVDSIAKHIHRFYEKYFYDGFQLNEFESQDKLVILILFKVLERILLFSCHENKYKDKHIIFFYTFSFDIEVSLEAFKVLLSFSDLEFDISKTKTHFKIVYNRLRYFDSLKDGNLNDSKDFGDISSIIQYLNNPYAIFKEHENFEDVVELYCLVERAIYLDYYEVYFIKAMYSDVVGYYNSNIEVVGERYAITDIYEKFLTLKRILENGLQQDKYDVRSACYLQNYIFANDIALNIKDEVRFSIEGMLLYEYYINNDLSIVYSTLELHDENGFFYKNLKDTLSSSTFEKVLTYIIFDIIIDAGRFDFILYDEFIEISKLIDFSSNDIQYKHFEIILRLLKEDDNFFNQFIQKDLHSFLFDLGVLYIDNDKRRCSLSTLLKILNEIYKKENSELEPFEDSKFCILLIQIINSYNSKNVSEALNIITSFINHDPVSHIIPMQNDLFNFLDHVGLVVTEYDIFISLFNLLDALSLNKSVRESIIDKKYFTTILQKFVNAFKNSKKSNASFFKSVKEFMLHHPEFHQEYLEYLRELYLQVMEYFKGKQSTFQLLKDHDYEQTFYLKLYLVLGSHNKVDKNIMKEVMNYVCDIFTHENSTYNPAGDADFIFTTFVRENFKKLEDPDFFIDKSFECLAKLFKDWDDLTMEGFILNRIDNLYKKFTKSKKSKSEFYERFKTNIYTCEDGSKRFLNNNKELSSDYLYNFILRLSGVEKILFITNTLFYNGVHNPDYENIKCKGYFQLLSMFFINFSPLKNFLESFDILKSVEFFSLVALRTDIQNTSVSCLEALEKTLSVFVFTIFNQIAFFIRKFNNGLNYESFYIKCLTDRVKSTIYYSLIKTGVRIKRSKPAICDDIENSANFLSFDTDILDNSFLLDLLSSIFDESAIEKETGFFEIAIEKVLIKVQKKKFMRKYFDLFLTAMKILANITSSTFPNMIINEFFYGIVFPYNEFVTFNPEEVLKILELFTIYSVEFADDFRRDITFYLYNFNFGTEMEREKLALILNYTYKNVKNLKVDEIGILFDFYATKLKNSHTLRIKPLICDTKMLCLSLYKGKYENFSLFFDSKALQIGIYLVNFDFKIEESFILMANRAVVVLSYNKITLDKSFITTFFNEFESLYRNNVISGFEENKLDLITDSNNGLRIRIDGFEKVVSELIESSIKGNVIFIFLANYIRYSRNVSVSTQNFEGPIEFERLMGKIKDNDDFEAFMIMCYCYFESEDDILNNISDIKTTDFKSYKEIENAVKNNICEFFRSVDILVRGYQSIKVSIECRMYNSLVYVKEEKTFLNLMNGSLKNISLMQALSELIFNIPRLIKYVEKVFIDEVISLFVGTYDLPGNDEEKIVAKSVYTRFIISCILSQNKDVFQYIHENLSSLLKSSKGQDVLGAMQIILHILLLREFDAYSSGYEEIVEKIHNSIILLIKGGLLNDIIIQANKIKAVLDNKSEIKSKEGDICFSSITHYFETFLKEERVIDGLFGIDLLDKYNNLFFTKGLPKDIILFILKLVINLINISYKGDKRFDDNLHFDDDNTQESNSSESENIEEFYLDGADTQTFSSENTTGEHVISNSTLDIRLEDSLALNRLKEENSRVFCRFLFFSHERWHAWFLSIEEDLRKNVTDRIIYNLGIVDFLNFEDDIDVKHDMDLGKDLTSSSNSVYYEMINSLEEEKYSDDSIVGVENGIIPNISVEELNSMKIEDCKEVISNYFKNRLKLTFEYKPIDIGFLNSLNNDVRLIFESYERELRHDLFYRKEDPESCDSTVSSIKSESEERRNLEISPDILYQFLNLFVFDQRNYHSCAESILPQLSTDDVLVYTILDFIILSIFKLYNSTKNKDHDEEQDLGVGLFYLEIFEKIIKQSKKAEELLKDNFILILTILQFRKYERCCNIVVRICTHLNLEKIENLLSTDKYEFSKPCIDRLFENFKRTHEFINDNKSFIPPYYTKKDLCNELLSLARNRRIGSKQNILTSFVKNLSNSFFFSIFESFLTEMMQTIKKLDVLDLHSFLYPRNNNIETLCKLASTVNVLAFEFSEKFKIQKGFYEINEYVENLESFKENCDVVLNENEKSSIDIENTFELFVEILKNDIWPRIMDYINMNKKEIYIKSFIELFETYIYLHFSIEKIIMIVMSKKVAILKSCYQKTLDFCENYLDLRDQFSSNLEQSKTFLNMILKDKYSGFKKNFNFLASFNVVSFDNKRYHMKQMIKNMKVYEDGNYPVIVRRDKVFNDSYFQIMNKTPKEFITKKIQIKFSGEEGLDFGGLTNEWLFLLTKEILNPDFGLFVYASDKKDVVQPFEKSYYNSEHLLYYKFIGRIIAKVIIEQRNIDFHLTSSCYKYFLGKKPGLNDLEQIDPGFYKSLIWIRDNDIKDVISLNFTLESNELGRVETIELVDGGENIVVTNQNKNEYIDLVVEYKLIKSIKSQLDAIRHGIFEILNKDLFGIFIDKELELLISGIPDINIDDWISNTIYNGYNKNSKNIIWFWKAVKSFDSEERAKLLQFATGSSRLPYEGFKNLQGNFGSQKFTIHRVEGAQNRLPSAHTCFNQLDLPEYSNYDRLRKSLILAINECSTGFAFI